VADISPRTTRSGSAASIAASRMLTGTSPRPVSPIPAMSPTTFEGGRVGEGQAIHRRVEPASTMLTNLRSLQVVRAIAATSVIYYHVVHLRDTSLPVFGSFGVDIFFVLSGFVMAMIISHGQRPSEFAAARLIRIVPLYWVFTTLLLVVALASPSLLKSTSANVTQYVKSLFFIPFFKDSGLLQPLLGVGWSLNYEMLFYLCLIIGLMASARLAVLVGAAILMVLYVAAGQFSQKDVIGYFFGNSLIFEFIFGLFAFEIYRRGFLDHLGTRTALVLSMCAWLLMAYFEASSDGMSADRWIRFGLPSVLLLLSATRLESGLGSGSRVATALTKAGDASYATYLSHVYVIELFRRVLLPATSYRGSAFSLVTAAVIIGACLAAGHGIYVMLDRPLHNYLKRAFRTQGKRTPVMS
jgi:exopolysaccharide production protein ExoZ